MTASKSPALPPDVVGSETRLEAAPTNAIGRSGVARTPGRPIVIAHRGNSNQAPENTLPSYLEAIALGATHLECDVHFSRDGVPMVIHDDDTLRTTGVAGKVAAQSAYELQQLDAGRWKSPAYLGTKIPTLSELLAVTVGKAVLAVELKAPGMEQSVVEALRAAGGTPQDIIPFAWEPETIARLQALEPAFQSTLLVEAKDFEPAARPKLLASAIAAKASILGLENEGLDRQLLRDAAAAGLRTFVWTVNSPERMQQLLSWGAQGIITDFPARGGAVLAAHEGKPIAGV